MSEIKWGCIQPLTGGMYIGALKATGCNARWIINYPGHCSIKYKNNEVTSVGNQANLLNWMKKNKCEVPIYTLDRTMFQGGHDMSPKYIDDKTPDFTDMDLVVAVPVCSGLSAITIASDDTKSTKNNNMAWITEYTLNVIKPKVYIFENAPALASDKGADMRKELEDIARTAGYAVAYFKTDTVLHHNCQKRQRTFAVFFKYRNMAECAPVLNFVADTIDCNTYFDMIPADATQQIEFKMSSFNQALLAYMVARYGENWQTTTNRPYVFVEMCQNRMGSIRDFRAFIMNEYKADTETKTKIWMQLDHVDEKLAEGKNFYLPALTIYKNYTPSIQFKSLQCLLHHKHNRLLTVREALWLMGMPHDFELLGDIEMNGPEIGQNVPVATAEYIVSEAVRIINEWDAIEREPGDNAVIYDNIKRKTTKI